MLTADDTPTIRFALQRRLGKEPWVQICDLKFEKYRLGDWYVTDPRKASLMAVATVPFVRVNLVIDIFVRDEKGDPVPVISCFDMPVPWELGHLHNEADEIAEFCKAQRRLILGTGKALVIAPEKQLGGTGIRGNWKRYG